MPIADWIKELILSLGTGTWIVLAIRKDLREAKTAQLEQAQLEQRAKANRAAE